MKASETRIFYGRTKTEDVSSGKERRGRRIVEKKIVGFKRIKHEKNIRKFTLADCLLKFIELQSRSA